MVSRNWARVPPGRIDALTDDKAAASTGTFCMGDRVELAVTMENKARVSIGASRPLVGSLLPLGSDVTSIHTLDRPNGLCVKNPPPKQGLQG